MIKKCLKYILQFFYCIKKIGLKKLLLSYDSKSKNIIFNGLIYGSIGSENISWDFSYINFLISSGKTYRIVFKPNEIRNSSIYWSPDKSFFKDRVNYTKSLIDLAIKIESNNNKVFPSSRDIYFYENKVFMHNYFDKLKIKTPKTIVCSSKKEVLEQNLDFPLLYKGTHSSGSKDIIKFNSKSDLENYINKSSYFKDNDYMILQSLINIRKDLRVTIVNDEIVLYYWRLNESPEWKPTASSFGGKILFSNLPLMWKKSILKTFKKTKLNFGAFDICWENDDLSSEPIFLEVSSRFSPNPVPHKKINEYSKWKKTLFGEKPYYQLQVDLMFKITKKLFNNDR